MQKILIQNQRLLNLNEGDYALFYHSGKVERETVKPGQNKVIWIKQEPEQIENVWPDKE